MSYTTIPPTYEQSQVVYDVPPPYYEEIEPSPTARMSPTAEMTEKEEDDYWRAARHGLLAFWDDDENDDENEDDEDEDDDDDSDSIPDDLVLAWQQNLMTTETQ